MSQQQIQRRKNINLKKISQREVTYLLNTFNEFSVKNLYWRGIWSHLLLNIYFFMKVMRYCTRIRMHARMYTSIIPFQCYVTKQLLPEWLTLIYGEDFLRSCLLFNLIMFSIKVMRFCTLTRMQARTHGYMYTHQ